MLVHWSITTSNRGRPFVDPLALIWLVWRDSEKRRYDDGDKRRNQATRGKNELQQMGNDGIESMSQFPETWRGIITWSILKLKRRMKSEPEMHANVEKSIIEWENIPPLNSWEKFKTLLSWVLINMSIYQLMWKHHIFWGGSFGCFTLTMDFMVVVWNGRPVGLWAVDGRVGWLI